MILIVTNEEDVHPELVTRHLEAQGHEVLRVNTERFPAHSSLRFRPPLSAIFGDEHVLWDLQQVKSAWYRRPGEPGISTSIRAHEARRFAKNESVATLEGLWRSLDCYWLCEPDMIAKWEHKLSQLQLASRLGFAIPHTLVTNAPNDVREFFNEHGGNIIVKPLRQNVVKRGEEYYSIFSNRVTRDHLRNLGSVNLAPCLFQEYVDKAFELRINVVGSQCFSAAIHSQQSPISRDDWRRYDLSNTPYHAFHLPDNIESMCIDLVRKMNLSFGAIDMIVRPSGEYVFLEVNPNGQWLWVEELAGLSISRAIAELLASHDT